MNNVKVAINSKIHYPILDGLRGVASIIVIFFHVFEAHALGDKYKQIINHGYLAVDFFFLLSGFVVAYAYDDRWASLTQWEFYKRRLIRLQPMVIMGSVIGAIMVYFQHNNTIFPTLESASIGTVLLLMIIGATLLPVPISMDIRGWQEMHPLNGPAWSLFYEYIANILYAIGIRRFSKTLLGFFVTIAALIMIAYLLFGTQGDLIGGWSLTKEQLFVGFTRLLYPFFAGVLLARMGKLIKIKNAFWWSSLLIVIVLSIPRIGDAQHVWMNGIYDAICVIILFPIIVSIGAGGILETKKANSIAKFIGDLSYPLYITHYPIMYAYTAWVFNNNLVMSPIALIVGVCVVLLCIIVAYACLKLYDEPVRKWLQKKYLH